LLTTTGLCRPTHEIRGATETPSCFAVYSIRRFENQHQGIAATTQEENIHSVLSAQEL